MYLNFIGHGCARAMFWRQSPDQSGQLMPMAPLLPKPRCEPGGRREHKEARSPRLRRVKAVFDHSAKELARSTFAGKRDIPWLVLRDKLAERLGIEVLAHQSGVRARDKFCKISQAQAAAEQFAVLGGRETLWSETYLVQCRPELVARASIVGTNLGRALPSSRAAKDDVQVSREHVGKYHHAAT